LLPKMGRTSVVQELLYKQLGDRLLNQVLCVGK
jgi:hypothetical protein